MKKKILIVTLNDYIIYQPTILNLYDALSVDFEVKVISFEPMFSTRQKDTNRNILYLETKFLAGQFFAKFDFLISKMTKVVKKLSPGYTYYHKYYNWYLPSILKRALKNYEDTPDIVIAADFPALHVAQQFFNKVHLLSLEIENNTNRYYKLIDKTRIRSVVIQSQMRYDYLLGEANIKKFIIPNSPVFIPSNKSQKPRRDFIWAGSIDRRLAVMECLNFFKQHPELKLVLKGGGDKKTKKLIDKRYGDLLRSGQVVINREYLPENEFIDFLSGYKIGFCFYSWDLIKASFNYYSAPSGKLLMCMAAGVPIVGCNIPGFKFVEEYGAGVLIDSYEPSVIFNAIQKIQEDYDKYAAACYRIAADYSFEKNVAPYLLYLKEEAGIADK